MFSWFKKSKPKEEDAKEDIDSEVPEFSWRRVRMETDRRISSSEPNVSMYMDDGSGYLHISMLVYVCRANRNMNKQQRKIIADFVRR